MNLYELASQDVAWGDFALDDDPTPWSTQPADPPAPVPPGPVPLDAALDAAAREYGVDADVLRALGPGSSIDSIFDTAASLRSRLEAFGGDYAQALASYRQAEEGHGGNIALAAPAPADAQMPAPGPAPEQAPSARPTAPAPRPRPARPPASTPVPGAPPPQAAGPDQPPAPPDGRLGAAHDPRSLVYRPAPATQKPLVDEVKTQLESGTKTLARMLPGTGAAAHWVATQGEPVVSKTAPTNVGSVLERAESPADLPSASFAPVRPEVRQAFGNAWDAASLEDRQRMQALPGWQGQLARERAGLFARADEGALSRSPTAALLDTRAEGRTKALIAKGEHPDFARRAAREGAAAGVAPGQEVKALGGTVQPSTYDFETKNLFDPNRPANLLNTTVGRGVAKGGLGLGKGVVGIAQLIEDGIGADDATKQRTADRATALRGMEQAIGERGTHLQRNAEGAIASITQQLPMLVTGSFVPSQLINMGSIAVRSFGQEYSDGKSRGLDPQQAAGRAGAFAAFEVIGEKFGFKGNMEAIRKATQGMPSDAVAGFLANLVKKEIPGEVLTTTGQFAVDKWAPAGMALKPNATFEDYFRQVGDTITQTVMQGGMMSGGRRVLGGGATPSAPRVQNQSTTPHAPQTGEATYESGTGNTTAPTPAPSPGSTAPATGYNGEPVPNTTQWSDVAAAGKKARAEAEILRQAEALPAQEATTPTTVTPSPATPWATPATPMPASTDGNRSGTQQGADALPHGQVNSDADQAQTATQPTATDPAANAPGAPATAPTPSTLNTEADASAAETAPTTTQHGTARQTAAAQIQPPTPIDAQIQALDSGMLVVGGDQAAILAHLQTGGVRGAEPFAGVTLVPVDQAALAQQVLSRPLAAQAGTVGPVGTQTDRGSQRASATATLPRTRTAAQLAPAATQAPTAGSSIAGPSPMGASAPRTVGRHGSHTSAAAPQPVPVMEMQRDGTLMVQGDPVQLQERLRQGGVERVLRREGGVLVGLDQLHKARQLLQQPPPRAQASAGATRPSQSSLPGQQFSRNAPDQNFSRARGLPSKPATVQSVKAAVAKLTNSMGLLANGLGRVVVATSADIQAHWEPLIGEVDMGSPDSGLAQGFYDPNSNTVFLIADHIEAGQEMAVAAHELVHKHGKAVLGEARWRQLHEVIGSWANRPEGSLERQVYDEAAARVQASRPDNADAAAYSSEELFPYAVQVAMELGVQPTALMPNNSVQGWLARVRASLKDVLGKLTGNPQAFDGQDLVDLAFGIAQLERSASALSGVERPNGSAPSAPYLPIQMSRDAGKDGAGAAPEKGPLGSENNPRPVPLTDFKVRITTDNDPSNAITMLVDGEDVDFASIEIKNGSPVLVVGKNGQKKSGEHVIIDAHGVTEAMLKAVISYYIETTGNPPPGLPGSLADDNRKNFRKEFDKHRESNQNGTADDWAQAAIRDISFGKARQKLGYGVFEIELLGSVNVGDLKGVPEEINVIARCD